MRLRSVRTALILLGALCAGTVIGQDTRSSGYLAPGALDTLRILPPAPEPGSARYNADRRIFRQTRRLEGSARWTLATADVDTSVPAMLRNFSCAADLPLSPQRTPRITALLARVRADSRQAVAGPKDFYRRRRPFLIDRGRICENPTTLGTSYDYPSGHTSWGWSAALVLAEIVPSRSTEILARGRAYGESRVVCGAHNASAVEAGRTTAAALVAALHGIAAFRDDLAAARAELAALAPAPPPADQCRAEAALQSSPY